MKAKDLMRKRVITVQPETTLRELARLFIERRITGAPVVDRKGKLLGVVSQTDLVRHEREASVEAVPGFHLETDDQVPHLGYHVENPDYTRVRDVMSPRAVTAAEETPAWELAQLMLKRHIHRVVITREDAVCGIVTSMDLLKALLERESVLRPAAGE